MPGTVNTVANGIVSKMANIEIKQGNKIIRICKNCYGKSRVTR